MTGMRPQLRPHLDDHGQVDLQKGRPKVVPHCAPCAVCCGGAVTVQASARHPDRCRIEGCSERLRHRLRVIGPAKRKMRAVEAPAQAALETAIHGCLLVWLHTIMVHSQAQIEYGPPRTNASPSTESSTILADKPWS